MISVCNLSDNALDKESCGMICTLVMPIFMIGRAVYVEKISVNQIITTNIMRYMIKAVHC